MLKKYVFLSIVVLSISSCKKNEKADVLEVTETKTETINKDSSVNNSIAAPAQQSNNAPVITTTTVTPNNQVVPSNNGIQQVPPPAPQIVAPGMNPSHGQPGHRCDIPVGAPLNTPVKAKNSQNVNVAPPISTPAPVQTPAPTQNPAPVATAPGTNPPHGQPGHRCDLAVGAPLPQ